MPIRKGAKYKLGSVQISQNLSKTLQNYNYPPSTIIVDCAEGDKLQAKLTQKLRVSTTDMLSDSLTNVAFCENK